MHRHAIALVRIFIMSHAHIRESHCEPLTLVYF